MFDAEKLGIHAAGVHIRSSTGKRECFKEEAEDVFSIKIFCMKVCELTR